MYDSQITKFYSTMGKWTIKEFIHAFPHDLPPLPYHVKNLLELTPVNETIQRMHSWNPNDKAPLLQVKENDFNTIYRSPSAQTTDCARVKQGYSNGVHAWEFKWDPLQRGTHAVVGVAEKSANLHSYGYTSVVGSNKDSWGFDINRNKLYHHTVLYYYSESYPIKDKKKLNTIAIPETFIMILDMNVGTLSFIADNEYLGVAFKNLRGKVLYPIVNVVFGRAKITCRYLGGVPPSLLVSCRNIIRTQVTSYEELCENPYIVKESHPLKCLPLILILYILKNW